MTVQNLLDRLNLYLGKFSGDTQEEQTQKINALNSAKDILLHQLGLPYSEKIYEFYFFDNQEKYPVPSDFIAPISLHYDETYLPENNNLNEKIEFIYEYPEKIIKKPKISDVVYWSIDLFSPSSSSSWERSIVLKTKPSKPSIVISGCDSVDNWSVSDDASDLSVDTSKYKTHSGSLKFKIDETTSGNARARITYNSPTPFDFSQNFLNKIFSFDLFIPYSQGIQNYIFKWGNDSSNFYFYITTSNSEDTIYDNDWNKFLVYWLYANYVGNPSPNNISFFEIEINYNEGVFISPQYFNLDSVLLLEPDKFILRYYSGLIVKQSDGALKSDFSSTTDTALYALADPTLGDLTAKIASYIYRPLVNNQIDNSVSVIKSISFDMLEPFFLKYPVKSPQYYRGTIDGPRYRYRQ